MPYPSNLMKFVSNHPSLKLLKDIGVDFLGIDREIGMDEVSDLLNILHKEKIEITFHDTVHPTLSDPGAYFSYSTEKSKDEKHWSMTYGNHGWSGGIYQISNFTLAKQIVSLIRKEKLDRIQISEVIFLSHYQVKSAKESQIKDSEIQQMHGK